MGLFASIFQPKSATGGVSDVQQLTASGSITVGVRQRVKISVVATAASTAPANAGLVAIKFSLGSNSSAASTDFQVPAGVYEYELGDEFDRINFNFVVATSVVSVMRITP